MKIDNFYFVVENISKSIDFYSSLLDSKPTNVTENRWADWGNEDGKIYFGIISKGSVNASEIYIKKILELALRYKAASAIIAHNHPSGIAYPSELDSESTVIIKNALSNLNIALTNHYIVAANQVFSMADSSEFFDLFL